MRLLHETVENGRFAMVQVASDGNIAYQMRAIHQIGHVFFVVNGIRQLALDRLQNSLITSAANAS